VQRFQENTKGTIVFTLRPTGNFDEASRKVYIFSSPGSHQVQCNIPTFEALLRKYV